MTASAAHSILPSLSAEERQHSEAAAALIRERLERAGGWLSFEEFMQLALYAPGLGYYSAGSVKLGAGGDFVTAPEISDLFSCCVAWQCAQVLRETGGEILEFGAGTGRMASVILPSLAELGVLPARYAILEVSADLADRQRERIARLPRELRDRVIWLDRLPATPLVGCMLANEVLDALPVHRFVMRAGSLRELGVRPAGAGFAWAERPASAAPDAAFSAAALELLAQLEGRLPEGYVSEIGLQLAPWIAGVGACLHRGMLLILDYGLPCAHYYHPQRADGTLRCHFKQRAHDDPFINIGVQDITAWVDFTRVAQSALAAGLEVGGFATQAAFLLGTGIEAMTAGVTDEVSRVRLAGEARRLLLPGEMGEAVKVMALTRELEIALDGFAHQDLRPSL
ncbi:MAG TPA: SAM-dependent methyltransferase [Steroidobacteraceae bacterium]|nr:SAM-dependent methyltransferase [Steroidobacteraceae bacterium]